MSGVIIYGDPHGEWAPLLRACAQETPDAVVILGDCELELLLRRQIAPVFKAGVDVRWIPGNHDADRPEWHDRLWVDEAEANLHGRWADLGGLIVAGLGGVFKQRVWYPRTEPMPPVYETRRAYLRQVLRGDRWRDGLPLRARDTIFPEDVAALSGLRVDVLVTHEAPSAHRYGFVGIDAAAAACRARMIVHGHHHESYEGVLASGTRVRGLAMAEVLRLRQDNFQ